jgi:hypothetical protein
MCFDMRLVKKIMRCKSSHSHDAMQSYSICRKKEGPDFPADVAKRERDTREQAVLSQNNTHIRNRDCKHVERGVSRDASQCTIVPRSERLRFKTSEGGNTYSAQRVEIYLTR